MGNYDVISIPNNPYGSGQFNNPWGRASGLNSQRNDLWTIDLTEAVSSQNGKTLLATVNAIQPNGSLQSLNGRSTQLSSTNFVYYPLSVSLPDVGIASDTVRVNTGVPYPYPGDDEVTSVVRLTFRHESTAAAGVSEIYTMLDRWRNLVRTGRKAYADDNVPLLSSSGGYRPIYRFTLPIRFYNGMDSNYALQPTAVYLLVNAWVRTIQISELGYGEAGAVTLAAQLCCDFVEPLISSGVNAAVGPLLTAPDIGSGSSSSVGNGLSGASLLSGNTGGVPV